MRLTLIYLAAGEALRFGGGKLTAEFGGRPLYRLTLDKLIKICSRHRDWELFAVARDRAILDGCRDLSVKTVYSPESSKGISYSIKNGISAADDSEAYAFFVADQPLLGESEIEDFLLGALKSGKGLGCVKSGEHTGNPTLFSRSYREELMALTGDIGGKAIIKRHGEDAYFHCLPARQLTDIDTRADLDKLASLYPRD